jgi:hypothetical protein
VIDELMSPDGQETPGGPSSLDRAAKVAGTVGVGLVSCASVLAGAVGCGVGVAAGAAYHVLVASHGTLLGHLVTGALLGLLLGVRLVVPIEEVVLDGLLARGRSSGTVSRRGRPPRQAASEEPGTLPRDGGEA